MIIDDTSKSIKEVPKMKWGANYRKAKNFMFASLGRIFFWSSVFAVTDILLKPSTMAFVCIVSGTIALSLLLDVFVMQLLNYLNFRRYRKWFFSTTPMRSGMDKCCKEIDKRDGDAVRTFCWNGMLWSSTRGSAR